MKTVVLYKVIGYWDLFRLLL